MLCWWPPHSPLTFCCYLQLTSSLLDIPWCYTWWPADPDLCSHLQLTTSVWCGHDLRGRWGQIQHSKKKTLNARACKSEDQLPEFCLTVINILMKIVIVGWRELNKIQRKMGGTSCSFFSIETVWIHREYSISKGFFITSWKESLLLLSSKCHSDHIEPVLSV